MADVVKINRAPVLTLWAAVVAERLGFEWTRLIESMGTLGEFMRRHQAGEAPSLQ
jgi:hypothetical protein